MKLKIIFAISILLTCFESSAQDRVRGLVVDAGSDRETPLPGAFVHWLENGDGVYTDQDGFFILPYQGEQKKLEVQFITYQSDTVTVTDLDSIYIIRLKSANELGQVTVFSRLINYGLSGVEPRTTINLSEREFQKAACCNLSESFQNAPAIDVSFSDAVTGTRQIKMLGLDGFYTLISREYMPAVRTLNSYYGLSFIPASWVNSIQITKGAGSIVNGYESIAGQINIEMRKPFDGEKFLLDQFVGGSGRSETDLMYQWNMGQHVASSVFAKVALFTTFQDRNGDGFVDNPNGKQIALMNRWQFYKDSSYEGQINASVNLDEKRAGQTSFASERDLNGYGITIDNKQWDVWGKLGKVFPHKKYKSFGSQFRFNHSEMNGQYGYMGNGPQNMYVADASSLYGNLMYETIIGTTFHKIKSGVSILADELNEQYNNYQFSRQEIVPGAFIEYTYQPREQLSFVGGIRADYNSIYGWTATPRFHSKWRFNEDKTSLRTSAGIGRRTSNILAQNQQIFVSNRAVIIDSSNRFGAYGLEQEVAFNTGLSFEHQFKIAYFPATFYLDFFHTSFMNEVVLDRETDSIALFYNVENGTRSNSFQAQLDLNPFRRTEIRLAYRMFDVSSIYKGIGRLSKPLISRNRAFINITQETRKNWQFNSTLQWYGPQRIPGKDELSGNYSNYSTDFFLLNFQVSKKFRFPFEAYLGAENILNYRQPSPIRSAEDPQSDRFDAGLVWGPVFGRMFYGGFRLRISYKNNKEESNGN